MSNKGIIACHGYSFEEYPKAFDMYPFTDRANSKNNIDFILNFPRIKLSQSNSILIDNRDTKESIVEFVGALMRKKTDFPDNSFKILEAPQLPPKFVLTRKPRQKIDELGSL